MAMTGVVLVLLVSPYVMADTLDMEDMAGQQRAVYDMQ